MYDELYRNMVEDRMNQFRQNAQNEALITEIKHRKQVKKLINKKQKQSFIFRTRKVG